ncbi:MAG: sodium:calcium antiporter [Gammaproteobacteria bacterium]
MVYLTLLLMLVVILVAAEIFTNALEHLGERMKISEGVTGSLFAAVGTALPETLVPLLAIFAGTADQKLNEDIGVGAILGAPLMLSTLTLFLMAVATLGKRGLTGEFKPERTGLTRDLNFFLFAFTLAVAALYVPHDNNTIRAIISGLLVATYVVYILLTLRASEKLVQDGHGTEAHAPMFLTRVGLPQHMGTIIGQMVLGLVLLVGGAKGFINGVEEASTLLGISPLVLSLLIIPIATELPEKINSVLWIRKRKDTLAFGNITGAMVFQGTLLPAIGIMLTPWDPRVEIISGIIITLVAALWMRLLLLRGRLQVWHVTVNGLLYAGYLGIALSR